MYFVWFGVFVVSINIAFQLYYGDEDISRVDQIKTGMKRVDLTHKIQTDIDTRLGNNTKNNENVEHSHEKQTNLLRPEKSTNIRFSDDTPASSLPKISTTHKTGSRTSLGISGLDYLIDSVENIIRRVFQILFSIVSPILYSIIG